MEPVAATLIGWLFLQEALDPHGALGIAARTVAVPATARSSQGLEVPKDREKQPANAV
ncbi:MAG: hypothetical protein U0528_18175 [Anaerolineae bacterium]